MRIPLEYEILDRILEKLYSSKNITESDIVLPEKLLNQKLLKKMVKKFITNHSKTENKLVESKLEYILRAAFTFLHEEKLIVYKQHGSNSAGKIRYAGIVKLMDGGFVGEYKRNTINKRLQRMFWIFSTLSFLLALISILISLKQKI